MRLHRFYISEKIDSQKEITVHSAELVNQILRVFRLKTGDSVILFDGSGNDYKCTISGFGKNDQKLVTFNVGEKTPSRFMPARDGYEITLCVAVVKKDTFEWIVEKATELGVTKIIPIMAERSEKKNLNEERLKKIAIEASEQSGRGTVPEIHPIISLKEAVEWVSDKKIFAVVFHTDAQGRPAQVAQAYPAQLEIFIGPEGGWSPSELEMFHSQKIPVVSLGNQVLRAETAVVAALSKVLL